MTPVVCRYCKHAPEIFYDSTIRRGYVACMNSACADSPSTNLLDFCQTKTSLIKKWNIEQAEKKPRP